jgi:hypothetical protein
MMRAVRHRQCFIAFAVLFCGGGCSGNDDAVEATFYERKIAPILAGKCATSTTRSGCHTAADDRGNAFGNLNLDSYSTLALRRDLFIEYGPYGLPTLLLKALPPFELRLTRWDTPEPILVTTDVAHGGRAVLDFTSSSFTQLERWIENGAAENNAPPGPEERDLLPCRTTLGENPRFDPSLDPSGPGWDAFSEANGVFGERCASRNCHGSPTNALYLTCGTSPEQMRWNYFAAGDYVSADAPASEIVRRVLAPAQGGTYHEGGVIFDSPDDEGYRAIVDWAQQQGAPPPESVPQSAGFAFFADRVQPMLVKRGCMQLPCHSPAMFHDYRLRGGSGGHFGLPATRQNYELSVAQLSLESPDPNASRLIAKNLSPPPDGPGMLHRGGSLLASGDAGVATCDLAAARSGPLNDQSPYCVIAAWIETERAERMAGAAPLSAVVYVKRRPAPSPDTPQDFGSYAPGSEVLSASAALDAAGALTAGTPTSLSALCALDPAVTDARRPAASWDGQRIAFSARTSATEPFRIYVVENGACALEPSIDAAPVDDAGAPIDTHGELVHNFDPSFAPDGRIVFTSTRGNILSTGAFEQMGPNRTPADPGKLNANLYVLEGTAVRQLTFLSNQELSPSFMNDGRVIFSTEKRAPDFYQLAGRRINLDGGDYHPLIGQRSTLGFTQLIDVVELSNKNFAAIVSDRGAAHGAGALAIINRSIGVDQLSTDPADYLADPAAIDWPNPTFFQHSVHILFPEATGKLAGTQGAFRNPSPLPNGKLLVSYAANVQDLGAFDGNFDIFVVDPVQNSLEPLISDPDDLLWPVAVYARQNHGVFASRIGEPNGATGIGSDPARSEITFVDVPLLVSLLFQNTRTGRPIPDELPPLVLWQSLPPEPGVTSFAGGGKFVTTDAYGELYVRRQRLGSADVFGDGSAKVAIPGGVPIVLETNVALAGDPGPVSHFQREEMQFYPGEVVRQAFRRSLFDGMCAGCHGSVSGYESHIAINPDILTSASNVFARDQQAQPLLTPGTPQGPPFP